MATGRNGSFNISTSNQFVSGYVSWNETYDIASNSSVVNAELRLSRTNTGYETYSSGEFYIAINGNEKRNSGTFSFTYNSNTLCVSHSVTVPHNADGSKSIEIYAGGELYYISPGLTVSKQSATIALTTIPRASSLSVPNGTLGSTIRLTVNRVSSVFTHTINWSAGGQSGSLTSVGAYVDWNIPYAIANGNTSGTSVPCSFTIITYNNGVEIGRNTAGCTLYIPNNSTTKPSLTLGNITVTNSGNISSWSEAVKGKSTLNLSVSSASGKYGADIESYRIVTTDGKSSNTSSIEVTPSTSGTYTITVTVTDTRGFTYTASKSISVYDYAPPVISRASVERCTSGGSSANEGTYVKINASYGYTNINGKNSITSAYASYRVSGSGAEYTSLGNISNGTPVVLGNGQLNIGASYDIRLTVTDTVGESDTYYLTLSTAKANIVAGFNKVGLGKYPEKDGYLEVGYKTKFEDDVDFENPEQVRENLGAASTNNLTDESIFIGSFDEAPSAIENIYKNLENGAVCFNRLNINGVDYSLEIYKSDSSYGYALLKRYGNGGISIYQYAKYGGVWSALGAVIENGKINISNPSGVLSLDNGGSGATTPDNARLNFGIKQHISCNNTDFNTIKDPGTYFGYTGLTNAKYNGISVLEVIQYSPDWLVQRQTQLNVTRAVWQRYYHSGNTWTDWEQVYTSNQMAWKKASVTFSSGSGSVSASGVTTSSTVIATRGDSAMSGGNYAMVAADCNSNGTIKMGLSNTNSGTYVVNLWWSK